MTRALLQHSEDDHESQQQHARSPIKRCSTPLKGESIRSLRGSFQKNKSWTTTLYTAESEEHDDGDGVLKDTMNNHDPLIVAEPTDDEAVVSINNNMDTHATKSQAASPSSVLLSRRRPAHEVRLQFLQNLGIHQKPPPPNEYPITAAENSNTNSTTTTTTNTSLFEPWGPSYRGWINDDGEDDNSDDNDNSITYCPLKEHRCHRIVQFQETAQIHPIPSHKVYSNRIKQTIWTSVQELKVNVARNTLEFSYEDWNADNVVDEESGLIWYQGTYVHPVHFHHLPPPPQQQQPPQQQPVSLLSSDEFWRQKCEALGIQPAEYYHSLSSSSNNSAIGSEVPTAASNNDAATISTSI